MQVDILREIVATDNGALAIISHLGQWFEAMAEEFTRTEETHDVR
jgi:hypothetical protein